MDNNEQSVDMTIQKLKGLKHKKSLDQFVMPPHLFYVEGKPFLSVNYFSEYNHLHASQILCDFVKSLGYLDIASEYERISSEKEYV